MTLQEHKDRHQLLHDSLWELVGAYTQKYSNLDTILRLLRWSLRNSDEARHSRLDELMADYAGVTRRLFDYTSINEFCAWSSDQTQNPALPRGSRHDDEPEAKTPDKEVGRLRKGIELLKHDLDALILRVQWLLDGKESA